MKDFKFNSTILTITVVFSVISIIVQIDLVEAKFNSNAVMKMWMLENGILGEDALPFVGMYLSGMNAVEIFTTFGIKSEDDLKTLMMMMSISVQSSSCRNCRDIINLQSDKCARQAATHPLSSPMFFLACVFTSKSVRFDCKGCVCEVICQRYPSTCSYCMAAPAITYMIASKVISNKQIANVFYNQPNIEAPDEEGESETLAQSSDGDLNVCNCGMSPATMKIIGGQDTEKNEYPWQVALVLSKDEFTTKPL